MASAPWAVDFSYDFYRRLLAAMRSSWSPRLFRDAPPVVERGAHALFLRHDVDVSLERALRMAEIEHEESVLATFMVMCRAQLYDLQSAGSRAALRRIAALGHEIGLHFDYPDSFRASDGVPAGELEDPIRTAFAELEDVLGAPVASISFHRPVPAVIRGPLLIGGRVNAYAERLMQRYISDSKGNWREGDPLPVIAGTTAPVLQVLVHPIWWGPLHRSAQERLRDLVDESTAGFTTEQRGRFEAGLAATLPGAAR